MSENGKSILMLTSTSDHGRRSRIVPALKDTAVVVPRGDVQFVATEYGVVNLFGKTLQERAMALVSIAHPTIGTNFLPRPRNWNSLTREKIQAGHQRGISVKV